MALDEFVKGRRGNSTLSTEEENQRTNSFLKETMRIGALYALAKTGLNKIKVLSGKSGKVNAYQALAAAATLGIATNEDTDSTVTIGGVMAFGLGKKGLAKIAYDNVGTLNKQVSKLNQTLTSWSVNKTEMKQRFREFKETDKSPLGESFAKYDLGSLSRFVKSDKSRTSSDAWKDYMGNSGSNKEKYKNIFYANKDQTIGGTGANRGFIDTMIKKEDAGLGFFSEVGKYTKFDSQRKTIGFDTEKLFEKGTDIGNLKTYFEQNYSDIKKARKKKDFNFATYLENKAQKVNASKFDVEFEKYYKTLTDANKEGRVTLKDLESQYHGSTDKLKKLQDNLNVIDIFGDVEIKNLGKDKNGAIFDKTILDPSSLLIDTMSFVEKAFKPVFSFMPGEKSSSFSIIPFDLKGIKQRRNKSDFNIIETPENIQESIENLKTLKSKMINGSFETSKIRKREGARHRDVIDNINADIDLKINELENYKSQHGNIKGNILLDDDVVSSGHTFKINPKNNQVSGFATGGITGFKTEAGEVSYRAKDTTWKTLDGKYDISYDRVLKENQFRAMGTHTAKSFTDYGSMHEDEYYYGDTLKSKAGSAMNTAADKFRKKGRKSSDIFNNELTDFVNKMDTRREDFFDELAQDFTNHSNFERMFGIKEFSMDLSDTESIKRVIKNSSLEDIKRNSQTIGKTVEEDILKIINTDRRTKNFFDITQDSLNNIPNETMSSGIKESFISNLLKTGVGEKDGLDSLFGNYKQLTEDYFKSTFINKPRSVSSATLTRITGSRGINKLGEDLNFSDKIGTTSGAYMNEFFNKMNSSLNYLGIHKVDEMFGVEGVNPNLSKVTENFFQIMTKRVAPMIMAGYALQGIEGITDEMMPDWVPGPDSGLGGAAAGTYAAMRLGFQVMMEYTGIQGAANYLSEKGFGGFIEPLELNISSDEMYDRYFGGKEVEIKRGRLWYGGNRTSFSGSDTKEYRQHFLYRMQNRTSGIYKDKFEKLYREDLLPTKLLSRLVDPYLEERRLEEAGTPMDKSEQLFTEIPVVGELLSATLGELIKPTQYYNADAQEIDPVLAVFDKAFQDIKSFGGYQGYSLSAASGFLFGGTSLSEIAANNFGAETRRLDSYDQVSAMHEQYANLELGGMFGLTEPIRRVFTNNYTESVSNLIPTSGEDWFQQAIQDKTGNVTAKSLLTDGALSPGKSYEQRYGTSPDELGKYGLIDRMRILGTQAPWSKQYFEYRTMAQQKLQSGKLSNKEAKEIQSIMSLRDAVVNKDTSIANNYVRGTEVINQNIGIESVLSYNQFFSNGKRYKLSGIEDDYNKLSARLGATEATSQMKKLKNYLGNIDKASFVTNKDVLSATKTDDNGEYIEVYSKDISEQFGDLSSSSYLETMSGGISGKIGSWIGQTARNLALPGQSFGNKSITGRDAYTQWYRESLQIPSFRSWETPIQSFIDPMFNLAQDPLKNSMLLKNTLRGMSGVGDSTEANGMLLGGMALSAVGDTFGLRRTPNQYEKEDAIQMELEQNKASNNMQSFYDLTTDSSYADIRSSLTSSERNMFFSLMNEVDSRKRDQIYDVASNRFKRIIDIVKTKQYNYATNNQTRIEAIDTTEMNLESNFEMTNDYFYNLAMSKSRAGYNLSSIEKRRISGMNLDSINQNANASEEERRNRYTRGRVSSKVISTIFGNDEYNYLY